MRTTVTLGDDVFEAARTQAQASAQSSTKSGLPVFDIQPDADIIPSNRARQLLALESEPVDPRL